MTTIVIPARTNSDRIDKKLMQYAGGKPIIQHTWENAVKADCGQVVIATDTDELAEMANKFGAEVVISKRLCKNGTERVADAAKQLELPNYEPVIDLQGDHCMTPPEVVRGMSELIASMPGSEKYSTLYCYHEDEPRIQDLSDVKVILNKKSEAVFFTRQPVPNAKRHCGIYGYHVSLLHNYVSNPNSLLEDSEHLEQMRFIDYGFRVYCPRAPRGTGIAINTNADLERFRRMFDE